MGGDVENSATTPPMKKTGAKRGGGGFGAEYTTDSGQFEKLQGEPVVMGVRKEKWPGR